jgi:hypothetical protein
MKILFSFHFLFSGGTRADWVAPEARDGGKHLRPWKAFERLVARPSRLFGVLFWGEQRRWVKQAI